MEGLVDRVPSHPPPPAKSRQRGGCLALAHRLGDGRHEAQCRYCEENGGRGGD